MTFNKESRSVFELNKMFSTTRRVVKSETCDMGKSTRIIEGGLRAKGYTKGSALDKPLISVITAVYNGAESIEQAVQSVINQTYDNVEYIVVDGGSTDGTLDILNKYDDVLDYWVSGSDEGVYDAMNKGLGLFQGDYVLFLGCDDTLFDVFHEIADSFKDKATSYYGDVILSNNSERYDGRFNPLKLFIKNIPHQAIFYSRYVFDEYRYECKYTTVADYALNLKVFANNRYGLKYINKTIAKYNNENGLSSTLVDNEFSIDKPEIIRKHYSGFYYLIYMLLRFVFR